MMEINTKEELAALLTDLQGKIANMQETVDKLSPVEEASPKDPEGEKEEKVSDEEISEIDQLLSVD